jgi:hypothetical protein
MIFSRPPFPQRNSLMILSNVLYLISSRFCIIATIFLPRVLFLL